MLKQRAPLSLKSEPSFLTQDDLAQISGFSVGRLEDLRSKTMIEKGYTGPDFFHDYDERNKKRVYYTVLAVRDWLIVKRPSKLADLDAWVAARTSNAEV